MQGVFSKKVKKTKKTIGISHIRNNYNTISKRAFRHCIGRLGVGYAGYWMVFWCKLQHVYTKTC